MSIQKIKDDLKNASVKDTKWLEKAKWRQENEEWLDISFAIAVKALSAMKSQSISQREFAEKMGCSPQYINKLLRGKENLQIETICKIQRILKIKLIEVPSSTSNIIYEPYEKSVTEINIVKLIERKSSLYNFNKFENTQVFEENNQLEAA